MLNNKKIIIVTPAGRHSTMELLYKHLQKEIDIIDEWRLWVNTKVFNDREYLEQLAVQNASWITLDKRWIDTPYYGEGGVILHKFFDLCAEPNTIYVRIDDDVLWLQENFIRTLVTWRIEHPEYFIVYPTILNNAVIDSLLQKKGFYPNLPKIALNALDPIGWGDSQIAEQKHNFLLDEYLTKNEPFPELFDFVETTQHVSVNVISWLGEDMEPIKDKIEKNEEYFLAHIHPSNNGLKNAIFGGAYCIHYSFFPQYHHLNKIGTIQKYQNLER